MRHIRLTPPGIRPVVAVEHSDPYDRNAVVDQLFATFKEAGVAPGLLLGASRSVTLERLRWILQTGVDVDPSTAVIFVDDVSKALEYGGPEQCLLLFDTRRLERTWMETSSSAPLAEIERLRSTYP